MRTSRTLVTRSLSHKIALSVAGGATVALAGFGGLAIANAQDTTPATGSAAPTSQSVPQNSGSPDSGSQGAATGSQGARAHHGAQGDRQARETEMAGKLANALGVDQQKVTDALTQIRAEEKSQHQAAGSTADSGVHPTPEQRRTELAQKLAEKLGLDQQKVADALADIAPQGEFGHGGHGGRAADPAALAKALGVDEQRLRDALTAVHDRREAAEHAAPTTGSAGAKPDRAAEKSAFAQDLATELGLDQATVEKALSDVARAQPAPDSAATSAPATSSTASA